MWLIGLVALVVGIVALIRLKACDVSIKEQEDRLDRLSREIAGLKKPTVGKPAGPPLEAAAEKPAVAVEEEEEKREIAVAEAEEAVAVPAPEEAAEVPSAAAEAPSAGVEPGMVEVAAPAEAQAVRELERAAWPQIDRERWAKFEEKLGKQWMTWVGAVVLFLAAGFFVKYAFDQGWLTEKARVIFGVVAGIAVTAAGERFVRRWMRPLGQGLIGAGLAILYVSLYAAYGFYDLLSQPVVFVLMVLVTAGGMVLAVVHDAIAISFLSVLGGFLTPVMLRTGEDPRDALFAYVLLLDVGVLGVAFLKRWRALDVLAFVGTWLLFTGWYIEFDDAPTYSIVPTVLWLAAFYVVFLIQPFAYHLRLGTPIVGERFFLAVSNAAGMFGWAYAILHAAHKHVLGLITLGMSVSYLVLGSVTRKRVRSDERAVFGFIALSVMFLTIAIPIHLDFHGVTVAWAVKVPALLYLAYKYSYFPVRAGLLISFALAVSRIFTVHWPLHEAAFTPVLNKNFGTAVFVALAGGAYALIHQWQRKGSCRADGILKVCAGIASAFLGLILVHVEVWQWLELSDKAELLRWASALVWVGGSAGFLAAGMGLRSLHARFSGFVALAVAGGLEIWDYVLGIEPSYELILNGRFLAALGGILVVFSYAFVYRRWQQLCRPDERGASNPLYGVGIILLVILCSFETWQWLGFRGYHYAARCVLPFLWLGGAAGCLGAGIRLRSIGLRVAGVVVLAVAGVLASVGYAYGAPVGYLMCFNWRFAAVLAVALMVFAYAFSLRYNRHICSSGEQVVSTTLYGIGIFVLIILATVETSIWLDAHGHEYLARCLVVLIWVAGAAGYLVTGVKLAMGRLRGVGLAVLSVAGILAGRGYIFDMDAGYLLCLNGRFLTTLAVVLMVFAHGFVVRRFREVCGRGEQITAKTLYGVGIALLFVLLSVETYLYFLERIADVEEARWVGQMSLSIVWGVYATAILVIGFWRNVRSLRLSALGLFGFTALKLVIVDMAHVKEVYRIISFFALGILMIGASYLYHRVEQQLVMTFGANDGAQEGGKETHEV
jgi:uncharacterized membrane protein